MDNNKGRKTSPASRLIKSVMGRACIQGPILAISLLLLGGCGTLPLVHSPSRINAQPEQMPVVIGSQDILPANQVAARLSPADHGRRLAALLEDEVLLEDEAEATHSPLYAGNKVTLLEGEQETYQAMWQALFAARDHIDLESYIIDEPGFGRDLEQLLLQKRAAGVRVHVIYDAIGSFNTPREFFQRLRAGGIDVLEFNPLNPLKAATTWQLNGRDHRRILCVDGQVAFTGGVIIRPIYPKRASTDLTKQAWRDTDIKIEGPAVAEFEKLFLATWYRKSGRMLADSDFFPRLSSQGHQLVRVVGSAPEKGNFDIYKAYINAINHAQCSIHITQAYFVPDDQLLQALQNAAIRGVDVRLILPGITDFNAVQKAGRGYYADLLAAGVKIYELQHAMLHAKTAVIDGDWSTIGSSNLDYRSFLANDEINVIALGNGVAEFMEAAFQSDLGDSRAINLQQWVRRPFKERFLEDSARVLKFLL